MQKRKFLKIKYKYRVHRLDWAKYKLKIKHIITHLRTKHMIVFFLKPTITYMD